MRDLSEADEKDVYKAAFDLLVRREHSSNELIKKLILRQCSSALAQQIADTLEAEGHLSNQRFAEEYTHSRIQKADGPLKILSALYTKGIDESTASQAMQMQDVDWYELAEKTFNKKLSTLNKDDAKIKQRVERFMRSRGYEYKFFKHLINQI